VIYGKDYYPHICDVVLPFNKIIFFVVLGTKTRTPGTLGEYKESFYEFVLYGQGLY
jgi:hypothetical protein